METDDVDIVECDNEPTLCFAYVFAYVFGSRVQNFYNSF